ASHFEAVVWIWAGISGSPGARIKKLNSNSSLAPEVVRAELERIVSSALFRRSERLARFLRFVTESALDKNGGELKEYVLGVEVFERGESFDPKVDPTVRIYAGKLRARLLEYYESEGRNDPVLISIPKGSYAPVFSSGAPPPPVKPNDSIAVLPFV